VRNALSDPNLLTLFGSILGIIGAILLSIDALGAPDFLAALKEQKEKGFRMAQIGFLALINNTFIYLAFSLISFISALILSDRNLVLSLIIAPFPYFIWKFLGYVSQNAANYVQKLGPRDFPKGRQGFLQQGFGCIAYMIHYTIWVIPYLAIFIVATFIRFGLDLPLTAIAELSFAPIVKQIYVLSSKAVTDEKKWHLKRNALLGSLFVFFGFTYQFVGTLMLIKW
jgi:hypothetical protein